MITIGSLREGGIVYRVFLVVYRKIVHRLVLLIVSQKIVHSVLATHPVLASRTESPQVPVSRRKEGVPGEKVSMKTKNATLEIGSEVDVHSSFFEKITF